MAAAEGTASLGLGGGRVTELQRLFDLHFDAYLQGPALLAALAGLGLVVGILTGMFGVGGGFLITPLLRVAFGVPYPLAIGSGLCYMIGVSSSGAARHARLRNVEPRSMLVLAATSMVGAVLGAVLNRFADQALGQLNYTLTMHALFIVMLLATAVMIGGGTAAEHSVKSLLQRLRLPPYIDLRGAGLLRVSVPGLCAVGLSVGVVKGMMGVGGGVLFVPLLILVVGLAPHQAVGTSLGVVLFSSAAGAVKYGLDGNVNMWIVMALMVSSVFGVQVGAWICQKLHAHRLRRYFAILVLLVVVALACDFVVTLLG